MTIPFIEELDAAALQGQRVFIRCDFNVPTEGDVITDDARIQAALPTIRYVLQKGGLPILASHFGRPKDKPDPRYSLAPVSERLAELLPDNELIFLDDCIGDAALKLSRELQPGQLLLLENLRFHPGEKKGDPNFAAELAQLADTYINDAFGTSHRADASMVALPACFKPGRRAVGYLIKRELDFLGDALDKPQRPFVAVLGGAKVSDKIDVIVSLLRKADAVLVGGAMAYTLLKARGAQIGASLVEDDKLDEALRIVELARTSGAELLLPADHLVARSIDADAADTLTVTGDIPDGFAGFDIGPATAQAYVERILRAKTVFWNGPMGVFEKTPFAEGTRRVAHGLADSSAITVVGGGDSAAAVRAFHLDERMTHISTGGGASLEFVEGKELPALTALKLK